MGGRGLPAYMGQGDTDNTAKAWRKIMGGVRDFARQYAKDNAEHGFYFDNEGNMVGDRIDGDALGMSFGNHDDLNSFHTHPQRWFGDRETMARGGSFSGDDIQNAEFNNERFSMAGDSSMIYILERKNWKPGESRRQYDRFGKAIRTAFASAKDKANKVNTDKATRAAYVKASHGDFNRPDGTTDMVQKERWRQQYWDKLNRTWLKNNAEKYGYRYGEISYKK